MRIASTAGKLTRYVPDNAKDTVLSSTFFNWLIFSSLVSVVPGGNLFLDRRMMGQRHTSLPSTLVLPSLYPILLHVPSFLKHPVSYHSCEDVASVINVCNKFSVVSEATDKHSTV